MRKNNVFFQNSFIISPHPLLFCHDVYPDFPKPKEKRYKDVLRKGSADSMGEAGKRCGKRGGKPGSGRPRTAEFRLKKQGSVQFSRPAFRMDFKGGENPFLMAREGHRKPPRHPSVRNIAKSGKGHFTGFSGRKSENIGLLWAKVRMFVPKSTDVLP